MSLTKSPIIQPFDSDAQRFIIAAGIRRFEEKRAINYLVQGLKTNNLWAKMIAIYPFVGGTSYSCKFNLKNPIDSVLAFALTFVANPTITNHGVDWNGTTQYADTNLACSTLTLNSQHLSYYSRENVAGAFVDIGVALTTVTQFQIQGQYNIASGGTAFSNPDTRGFFIISRTASNVLAQYRNGASVSTGSQATTSQPTGTIFIGARNVGGAANFSSRECAFSSIGTAISVADAFVFNEVVQQFQLILNRQV